MGCAVGCHVLVRRFPVPAALVWGIGLLIASCWLTYRLALLIGAPRSAALLAAALTALMPRLVWGALSGMEVSLYVFMALLAIVWHLRYGLYSGWRSYLSTVAFALAALGRPECYVLFPIAWVDRVLTRKVKPHRLIPVFLSHLVLYCLILTPNWIFNLSITGSIFPATFHAKVLDGLWEALRLHDTQMLVESLSTRPISFVFQYIVFLLENNLVLFIPALCGVIVLVRRRRQTGSMMVPLVLILVPLAIGVFGRGHLSARYIANLIPLYAVSAVVGIRFLSKAIQDLPVPTRAPAIAMKAILIIAFLNAAAIGVFASGRYGWMVENINTMHVRMGHWIAANIPKDALVAIKDVGAMTYFGDRKMIDTVGLTTPEIIAYLKDPEYSTQDGLLRYLRERRPDYLVAFLGNYPSFEARNDLFELVYTYAYPGDKVVGLGAGDVAVVYCCHWLEK